jgi:hypothetical protein
MEVAAEAAEVVENSLIGIEIDMGMVELMIIVEMIHSYKLSNKIILKYL